MIRLNEVGAFVSAPTSYGVNAIFGVYLPGIERATSRLRSFVRVIHKDDRFVPDISTMDFPLTPVAHSLNNLWQANGTIPVRPGTYLYRYQLLQTLPGTLTPKVIARWFTDPFARATDIGRLSAFVTPSFVPDFVWTDQ